MTPATTTLPHRASGPRAVLRSLRLADGRQLGVRTWPGSAEQTIVLLHGLLDSSEGWASTCAHRNGFPVPAPTHIAFDVPGFGHSDAPAQASIDSYARDIIAGLDQLGVTRFALVGHSLGGAIAARLAELVPDRVESLILLAPAGFGRIHLAELACAPMLHRVVSLGMPVALSNRAAVGLGYRLMVTNGRAPDRGTLERVTRRGPQVVAGARQAIRAIAEAGAHRDGFHGRPIFYEGPVTAIWGDRDRLVPPAHRHALIRALPQARVELWRGMGHHPQHERLEGLLDVVRRTVGAAETVVHAAETITATATAIAATATPAAPTALAA